MCGIAGFFSVDPTGPDDRPRVEAMGNAITHRGPDGRGTWFDPQGHAGFAHTRLAILDLSEAARQPMDSPSGRSTIVFNGEIYNFAELRTELEGDGQEFRTRSDTEVILALYERRGVGAFSSLRGMFAFAIWDRQEHRAVLARDGLGIKPLYLFERDGQLWFASELRALLASGKVTRRLDPGATAGFFLTGSIPEPLSSLTAVTMAAPGTVIVWKDGRATSHRFWVPRFAPPTAPVEDAVTLCRTALESSVRAHLVSDVPVALLLSGGMDSTAILALMKHLDLARELHCFSIAVDDPARDEGDVARRTAAKFGVEHHVIPVDASIAGTLVDEYFDSLDVPSVDGFNTWLVTRFLRRAGFKVALSGVGGDEIFGGYSTFRVLPRLRRAVRGVQRIPGVARIAAALLRGIGDDGRRRRMADMLSSSATLPALYSSYRGSFSRDQARVLAAHFCGVDERAVILPDVETVREDRLGDLDQVCLLELERYMRNQLLRDTDVTSMSHGVELRVPFVDTRLVDALLATPAASRIRAGKRLLHEAVPEIPDYVARAPKRGFALPFAKWLGEGLQRDWASGRKVPVKATHWYQTWAINGFERWLGALGLR